MGKITEIRTHLLGADEYPRGGWVLVRVHTDEGIEGVGECFVPDHDGDAAAAVRQLVDGRLAAEVLGASILDLTPLWERCYEVCGRLYDRRGLAIHALSGLDLALHDGAAYAGHPPQQPARGPVSGAGTRLCEQHLGRCRRSRTGAVDDG